ncbi:uncharacterized protein Z518_07294 [Rhinocladiella mackenziei CBS 650.93]|uniref:Heterokaryon incompatibility domain-containing protein n=1 Tax=Rhinocladiella mackenziei CBS 650.93 TaxID=1442369 RepID=A0A0D2IKI1_9EURO|nr:uncharacterized protein Z518_07294 [Rhinocladiella mackenziei CBS 650.93]KIX03741.1 hypothetical protein Z518_07294 [Rhinocladiella mackenziei CBS 650.93]
MSRWHESGCRSPDVALLDNLPFCNYCFAIALHDGITHNATLPILPLHKVRSQSQMNLTWPSVVHYSRTDPASDDCSVHGSAADARLRSSSPIGGARHHGDAFKPWNETALFPRINTDDQIRLLRVTAGQPGEPVHVHAEVACLKNSSFPPYDILSYIKADDFGDNTKRCPIFIGPYWDIVYVPLSSEEAFRSIRYKQADRTMWVDFLCINQEDVDENTRQVSLLREILTNASGTLIYPGHASADTGMALDFIESTASTSRTTGRRATGDQKSRSALQSLVQRLCFSRVWAIQEVLLAKRLEIVYEQRAVPWPEKHSGCDFIDTQVSSWLLERRLCHGSTGRGLVRLLLYSSLCQCSDPRDKVFGILGLFRKENFTPDYRLCVESVYIGVAAYLIKNCRAFEIFALATTAKRELCIPSWVPDWSHPVTWKFPEPGPGFGQEDEVDMSNDAVRVVTPVVFDSVTDSEPEILIDANTGSLQIRAWRLCAVTGEIVQGHDQTKVIMNKGRRGTLVLSVLDGTYRIGSDFVFLLHGWDHPIVLRHHPGTDSYSVISVCAIAFGPPSVGTIWLLPSKNPSLFQGTTKVSKLTQVENDLLLAFHSNLSILCETHLDIQQEYAVSSISPTVEAMVLDFSLLSLTGLSEVESRLRDIWNNLEQQLGWMFLDQVAVWHFLRDMDAGSKEDLLGEGTVLFDKLEATMCERFCGLTLPSTYQWDLRQFCWSFIRTPIPQSATSESNWTPMLTQLKSQLSEIRRWVEVSEQLLIVFEYSRLVLQKSWTCFPGTGLPEKWRSNWRCFHETLVLDPGKGQQFHPGCLWDWAEFKTSLCLRGLLQEQKIPPQLDPSVNINMAARLGLRSLGLELDRSDRIQID